LWLKQRGDEERVSAQLDHPRVTVIVFADDAKTSTLDLCPIRWIEPVATVVAFDNAPPSVN
jgi:hypothetical protein